MQHKENRDVFRNTFYLDPMRQFEEQPRIISEQMVVSQDITEAFYESIYEKYLCSDVFSNPFEQTLLKYDDVIEGQAAEQKFGAIQAEIDVPQEQHDESLENIIVFEEGRDIQEYTDTIPQLNESSSSSDSDRVEIRNIIERTAHFQMDLGQHQQQRRVVEPQQQFERAVNPPVPERYLPHPQDRERQNYNQINRNLLRHDYPISPNQLHHHREPSYQPRREQLPVSPHHRNNQPYRYQYPRAQEQWSDYRTPHYYEHGRGYIREMRNARPPVEPHQIARPPMPYHARPQRRATQPQIGLRPAEVAMLTEIKFRDSQCRGWDENDRKCSICLSDFATNEKVRFLPCLHRFHSECVDAWLASNIKCPLCKKDVKQLIEQMIH